MITANEFEEKCDGARYSEILGALLEKLRAIEILDLSCISDY